MGGMVIFCIIVFGCAILFLSIGLYAERLEKPMWFYSGTSIDPSEITDLKAYNKENARMWKRYSLWFFGSGIAYFWSIGLSLTLLVLACTLGMGILVFTYNNIEKKYRIRNDRSKK